MPVDAVIRKKLMEAFQPSSLAIENESAKHAGHAGMAGHLNPGETHFRVTIVSHRFEGQTLIERHRAVNAVLAEELAGPVHALAIRALTPADAPGRKQS
jgi:BolA protein